MSGALRKVWNAAAAADPTLVVPRGGWGLLEQKRLRSQRFSRLQLFRNMARGNVSLFQGVPIRLSGDPGLPIRERLVRYIRSGFPENTRARVQMGPDGRRAAISISRLMEIWERGAPIVSTTDLHFRDTPFESRLRAEVLSDFNLLCAGREPLPLEMMTLVVSAAGNVTDSHSDDSDGSNHCFVGSKLWLAWNRLEAGAEGLQDVSHDDVTERATFDMHSFLSLKSSRWWVVEAGKTLFLPGHLTHKVITLAPYIGFGSFHVSFPAYLRTLSRWILHNTTDVNAATLRELNDLALLQLRRLRHAPPKTRARWGTNLLSDAYRLWLAEPSAGQERVGRHPVFKSFVEQAF